MQLKFLSLNHIYIYIYMLIDLSKHLVFYHINQQNFFLHQQDQRLFKYWRKAIQISIKKWERKGGLSKVEQEQEDDEDNEQ